MNDILTRCLLVHHEPSSYSEDQLENVFRGILCNVAECDSKTALAFFENPQDVEMILKSRTSNLYFEKFCIIEDEKSHAELNEIIAELAQYLSCQKFDICKRTLTRDGRILLEFDDLSCLLFTALKLTNKVEEYLQAVYNASYCDGGNIDVISQSFVVTGFPAGSSKEKIQIALQRTKNGGGEVECIHPVGSIRDHAIAIFADSHVADRLKAKRIMNSDKFPGHILNLIPLTNYGDLGSRYIQVKDFKKYETIERTKDKLTINLQEQSVGGGDVKDVIYPVGPDEDIAIVEFHDKAVSDNFLRKKKIEAKDGAAIHFKEVVSLIKCVKQGFIGKVSESALKIIPEIKDALNKHEGTKWECIADNKYFFYKEDSIQALRSIARNLLLELSAKTYRKNDIRYPPKHESSHSKKLLPVPSSSMMMEEASGRIGGGTPDIQIEDMEYTLLDGTKLIIRHGDITEEDVDVIVNATNGNLDHFGGVALAIAKKAGPEIEREGYDLIKKKGYKLSVTECAVTEGYNLKAKHVIHAVGPNKHDPGRCFREDLLATFSNCLKYADSNLKAKTIGVPLISSGIGGGDVQECAEELTNAIIAFQHDRSQQQSGLMEIRIVNNSIDVTLTIQDILKVLEKNHKIKRVETDEREEYTSIKCKDARATDNYHLNSASHELRSRNLEVEKVQCCLCKRFDVCLNKLHCSHDMCDKCLSITQKIAGRKTCPECKEIIAFVCQKQPRLDEKTCALENSADDGTPQEKEMCVICLDDLGDKVRELQCKHKFCQECIDQAFKVKPVCPSCGMICGEMKGNQPPGTMNTSQQRSDVPGYAGHGTIEINYKIPSGKQTDAHPNPGQRFQGTHRTAYLPNNDEGKHVAKLLQRAFNAALVFTVGISTTSGSSNVVTWNDIHHKTNTYGGPEKYGYPDPTYLKRVQMELADKGIK